MLEHPVIVIVVVCTRAFECICNFYDEDAEEVKTTARKKAASPNTVGWDAIKKAPKRNPLPQTEASAEDWEEEEDL